MAIDINSNNRKEILIAYIAALGEAAKSPNSPTSHNALEELKTLKQEIEGK